MIQIESELRQLISEELNVAFKRIDVLTIDLLNISFSQHQLCSINQYML